MREHVIEYPNPDPDTDYCGFAKSILASDLAKREGFEVQSGWKVTRPGGEVLEGDDICRLALLAVWLDEMSDGKDVE